MPLSCTVNALLYSLSHNYSPLIAYNCYTCSPILTPSYAFTFFRLVYSNSFCAFTLFYILHYLLNNNCALQIFFTLSRSCTSTVFSPLSDTQRRPLLKPLCAAHCPHPSPVPSVHCRTLFAFTLLRFPLRLYALLFLTFNSELIHTSSISLSPSSPPL